jgi:murein DD-endopeptidase MepM/ murein hydrolase activator NlpD
MKYPYIMFLGLAVVSVGILVIFKKEPIEDVTSTTSPIPAFESPSIEPSPVASPIIATSSLAATPSAIASPITTALVEPIAEFKQRITKKRFGTYVTPNNSPVQPEKFTGYHTGVDVEYDDVSEEVQVVAIADGTIVQSNTVSGYGGVVIIEHTINGTATYVLYGHLAASSMVGRGKITKGQKIGILGKGNSSETDGERKHLHLSIRKTHSISVKGYVQSQNELSAWHDPLTFYP